MSKSPKTRVRPPQKRTDALQRAEAMFAARYPPRPEPGPPEIVDPRWLLKAGALVVTAALLCAYATLCLLVYQGQWQLLLHPAPAPVPSVESTQEVVHFGASATGQPELTGLWLPASGSAPTTPTLLYLPDGSGNLLADQTALREMQQLPVNVFALDYRGFGASASPVHPTEERMLADAGAALQYLTGTRHIAASTIVPYGVGLGGSLAVALCAQNSTLPALILESPQPEAAQQARRDSRARLVPLWLFQHEQFAIQPSLSGLKTPRLLLDAGPSAAPPAAGPGFARLSQQAGSPSMTVHLAIPGAAVSPTLWRASILRFLDEYLPGRPA